MREMIAREVSAPPTYEELLKVLRPTTALLYRIVWHYSKRPGQVCRLPLRELARRLHVGQSTILLHLRALVEAGYVVDLTPDAHKKVHEYVISGKPVCGPTPSCFASLAESAILYEEEEREPGE